MNEKDQKILEILQSVYSALYWLNSGGTDINDEVKAIDENLAELQKIISE